METHVQHLLSEDEYKNLVPLAWHKLLQASFNDAHKQLEALQMAVNEHPDSERILQRQREILARAEAISPELFQASANLLLEKDQFDCTRIDYGEAVYAKEKAK
jgi:hypothetical protein